MAVVNNEFILDEEDVEIDQLLTFSSEEGSPQVSELQTPPIFYISKQPKDSTFFHSLTSFQNNANIDEVTATVEYFANGYNDKKLLFTCTPYVQMKNSSIKEIHPCRLVNLKDKKTSKLTSNLMDPIKFVSELGNKSSFNVKFAIVKPGNRSKAFKREIKLSKPEKNYDLNKVFLKFEVREYKNGVVGDIICEIFSNPISNDAGKSITPKISSPCSSFSFDPSSPSALSSLEYQMSSSPSSSSSSSPVHDQSDLLLTNLPSTNDSACILVITRQPEETTYFRNESEIDTDKHGHIKARDDKKEYPTVKLTGFYSQDDVLITCTPQVKNKLNNTLSIHPYRLVRQDRKLLSDDGVMDPYVCIAEFSKNYTVEIKATFLIPGKDSHYLRNGVNITKRMRNIYELNEVILCFEAFELKDDPNGKGKLKGERIAKVYSDVIGNQRNSDTNKLEIKDFPRNEGNIKGGTVAWIKCSPVKPDAIKVRFSLGEKKSYAHIEAADKHLIIIRTPPFWDKDVALPVTVNVQLERGNVLSDAVEFKYVTKARKSLKRSAKESDSGNLSDSDENEGRQNMKVRKISSKRNTKLSKKVEKTSVEYRSDSSNENGVQCKTVDSQNVVTHFEMLETNVSNTDYQHVSNQENVHASNVLHESSVQCETVYIQNGATDFQRLETNVSNTEYQHVNNQESEHISEITCNISQPMLKSPSNEFSDILDKMMVDSNFELNAEPLSNWNENGFESWNWWQANGDEDIDTYINSFGSLEFYSQRNSYLSIIKIFFFNIIEFAIEILESQFQKFKSRIFTYLGYSDTSVEDIKFYNDEAPEVNINDIIEDNINKTIEAVNNENTQKGTSYFKYFFEKIMKLDNNKWF
ncbi:uncharacterized protein LOC129612992 [Condylostylus longicornis]|uniref:uncharacterized protein LOC129612992 n=1 Tax=Condylostylus longicornis TaxID=2530218 RepID=UPI00244E3DFA|nr:uncharacterized protein LOC129612992 [Condylostylus longicornis]